MAVMIQMQFASAVTEIDEDACVGSSMENGTTMIMFALRQHDFHQELGTQATLWWRTDSSHVDVHELSTFHHPILYRCIVAQGSSLDGQFLIPMTKASIKRWMDAIGSHLPTPEQMLQHLLARTPATECHIDGSDPLGTDHGVLVVKDEPDRILITHEAASEHGEDARQLLQHIQDRGLNVTAAFSDDSPSFTEAIKAVWPHARFQADHFHTVKHIWGHLKKALLSSRRQVKASGAEKNDAHLMALAKQVWTLRWALLKKPTNLSLEEKQTQRFRRIIRPLVNIFDHAHSEAQAKIKLKQLRQEINAVDEAHLQKILTFFDDHWEQALRYLRNKGMGKHRRGSNSESGRRLLRRLEKNHDGIRSVGTRQHYMQIYQAIQYLSVDIAEFREQGPQMTGPPRV